MKNYLSLKSVCGLAVVVLMTSCVAKKKYTEAQNTITQLQTENAQLKETGTSMQQNLATLETTNRGLQTSLDSTNTWVTGQQTRWNSFQAFYDEGVKTTEQVHQMLHTQLDNLIGAENITTNGGRIYVTLAEKTLFSSGSSKLSTKGQDVLTSLAQAIKDNPNVEIDIASTPGYYMAGNTSMDNGMSMNNSSMNNQNNSTTTTTTDQTTTDAARVKQDDDMKYKDESTKVKVDKDGDVKIKQKPMNNSGYTKRSASSSYSGSAKKSSGTKSTAHRTSSESKSKTYASSPSRKSSTSASSTWSLNMARSGAIAKKLVDEGVAKSRILVNSDNTSGTSTTKDFQIVISPKAETYYQSIGNGSGNTSGGMNNK
jgi:outer membrane protein OmpA-like peptidoglycan-associated protein